MIPSPDEMWSGFVEDKLAYLCSHPGGPTPHELDAVIRKVERERAWLPWGLKLW